MDKPVTLAEARGWRFRLDLHADGAAEAIWQRTCVENPRVTMLDVFERRARRQRRRLFVDNVEVYDLAAAVAALNAPAQEQPEITLDDMILELERELPLRRSVYGRRVSEGKMTAAEAERRIAVMLAVLRVVQKVKNSQPQRRQP